MTQFGSAVVFTNSSMGPSPMLGGVLRELGIPVVLPHQLPGNSNGVSVVIIERPLDRAETICVNLRKYKEYAGVPILVLTESPDPSRRPRFKELEAEVLPPPLSEEAVRGFLTERLLKRPGREDGAAAAPPEAARPVASPPPAKTETREETAPAQQGPAFKPRQPAGGVPRAGKTVVKEVKKVVRPPSELPDEKSPSSRLLEGRADAAQLPVGSVRCAYCPRWFVRREDAFCSRCGEHLIALDPVVARLVFEPRGSHCVEKLIGLKNGRQNPLRATFRIVADEEMESRLSLSADEAALTGGAAGDLRVTLDARGLDLSSSYEALLEIETNEQRGGAPHTVRLSVERLARPKIIAKSEYVYSLNAAHQPNQWEFALANEGGRTLSLKGVELTLPGGNDEVAPLELLSPAPVRVGGGQTVPVRVKLPDLKLSSNGYRGKLTCLFEQHEPASLDLAFEAKKPRSLVISPPDIDFEVVSTQGSKTVALTLRNVGEENLHVTSVSHVPPFPWLTLPENLSFPLLIPRGGSLVIDLRVSGAPELAGVHPGELIINSDSYRNQVQPIPFVVEFQEPEEFNGYMGIDFGTTASCVAVLENNDLRLITIDHYGEQKGEDGTIMPSVLYVFPDGKVLAGHEADVPAQSDPMNAVRAIKRVLGMHDKQRLAGREYDSTELAALVIKQLRERAEPALSKAGKYNKRGRYKTPKRAVLTVPVDFAEKQRRALLEASSRSGLNDNTPSKYPTVLDEALAVALYYQRMRRNAKPSAPEGGPEHLLVFDFGGGTLDCGLIEIRNADQKLSFRTMATYGDSNLGGEDIDWALVELLAARAAKEQPEFDNRCLRKPDEPREIERLYRRDEVRSAAYIMQHAFKKQAEQAKIVLGEAAEFSVRLGPLMRTGGQGSDLYVSDAGKAVTFETTLQQQEFEQVLAPFVERAVRVIEVVCARGGISPADVTTILHAGRSSLIPQLKAGVNAFLPQATDRTTIIKPKVCVALGAAFYARLRTSSMKDFEIVGGANRVAHDIGYINEGLQRVEFVPVIRAQTPFPTPPVEVRLPSDGGEIDLQVAENRGVSNVVDEGNSDIIYGDVFHLPACENPGEGVPVEFKVNDDGLLEIFVDGKQQKVRQLGG